jgi:hypothetical protein
MKSCFEETLVQLRDLLGQLLQLVMHDSHALCDVRCHLSVVREVVLNEDADLLEFYEGFLQVTSLDLELLLVKFGVNPGHRD